MTAGGDAGLDADAGGEDPCARSRAQRSDGAPPAQGARLNAPALAKEVALDRLERLLERMLAALRRYRARRGNWWERG